MSRKLFVILLALTVVVGLFLLLWPGGPKRAEQPGQALLLPDLAAVANDLERFQIIAAGAGAEVSLKKLDGRWVVEQSAEYPADWDSVRTALAQLAQAVIVEAKTSRPEFYDRLGVEDLDSESAQGVLVRFADSAGLPAVIVGNSAQGREGQYARIEGAAQSVLLDREIELTADLSDWLDRRIVDISNEEIVEVLLSHPDGETISASRVSADDTDFTLQEIPEGKEIKSNWTVNSLAGVFSALDLDEVARAPESLPETAVHHRVVTADGLQIDAHWYEQGDGEELGAWLVLKASAFDEESAAPETLDRVTEINQRVDGWAYQVPDYKFDSATKRMDDLVQDATPDSDAATSSS